MEFESIPEITRILDIMDVGVTEPVKCILEDGELVIVKYWRNRFGPGVLINEWICGLIAKEIDLSIPDFGLCFLSEDVIEKTNSNEEIDKRNAGIAFYSKMIFNTVPESFQILEFVSNKQFERMLVFDALVSNKDRHEGNIIIEIGEEFKMHCIDNSHILFDSIGDEQLSVDEKIKVLKDTSSFISESKNKAFYTRLAFGIGLDDVRIVQEIDGIRKKISKEIIMDVISTIPQEWITDTEKWRVDAMREVLFYRIDHLDDIVSALVEEIRG